MQRAFFTALLLAFTAGGIALMTTGETVGGAMLVCFFGVGGSGYVAMPLLTREGAPTVELVRIGDEPAFLFPVPRVKRLAGVVATTGVGAGCVLLAFNGDPVVGWLGLAFFAALLAVMVRSLRRPRGIVLTPTRVQTVLAEATNEVPWQVVAGAEIYEQPARYGTMRTLGIIAPAEAVTTTRGSRWFSRLDRGFTGHALAVGAHVLAGPAEDVIRAVELYRDDPLRRAAIGTSEERDRLTS